MAGCQQQKLLELDHHFILSCKGDELFKSCTLLCLRKEKGLSVWTAYKRQMIAFSWCDKKALNMLMNCYKWPAASTQWKNGRPVPNIILGYHSTLGFVNQANPYFPLPLPALYIQAHTCPISDHPLHHHCLIFLNTQFSPQGVAHIPISVKKQGTCIICAAACSKDHRSCTHICSGCSTEIHLIYLHDGHKDFLTCHHRVDLSCFTSLTEEK